MLFGLTVRRVVLSPVIVAVLFALVPSAACAAAAPRLSKVVCVRACVDARTAQPGSLLRVTGRRFSRPLRAVFAAGGTRRRSAVMRVTTRGRASVAVPSQARGGVLYVRDRHGRRSNRVRPLKVRRPTTTTTQAPLGAGGAFDGDGMWIWYVSRSAGGDPQAIAAQALAHGVGTVFVKSSDGATAWSQFSPALLAALKSAGVRVCAWQFVYGDAPEAEAARGAEAVRAGADCLVIDAESHYEGRYAPAQRYMTALRTAIGTDYPVGLTSFPYVDYHPSLPYSVFLGPGGAQVNLPQVYWKAIGGGVDAVVAHTYAVNRPYARAVAPIGQLYDDPPVLELLRFRQLVASYGSGGASWWDWAHAGEAEWDAVGTPVAALPAATAEWVSLGNGSRGDLVVWAQEHLNGSGVTPIAVSGRFDAATRTAVQQFQLARGIAATGVVDAATWQALLAVAPVVPDWTAAVSERSARRSSAVASAARAPRVTGPWSAALPARRNELRSGAGQPSSAAATSTSTP